MQDAGFVIGFVVVLIFLAIYSATTDQGLFEGKSFATPIPSAVSTQNTFISQGSTPKEEPQLTNREIEQKIANNLAKLDSLKEELRVATLNEPVSPYRDRVTLQRGNAQSSDVEQEYIELQSNYGNTEDINISNWYVESYVTENSAAIPEGAAVFERRFFKKTDDIFLEPGERAYLLTKKSPVGISFEENMCTGYLANNEDFSPSLSFSCPVPEKEMLRFANIALDNDSCYDFVERINQCETADEDSIRRANLTGACRQFIERNLNYEDCVKNHRNEPFFDDVGVWRIYFEREKELWRFEREIIRLIDENDQVIDVIEY